MLVRRRAFSGKETTAGLWVKALVVTAEDRLLCVEHFLVGRVSTRVMLAGGCPVMEAWDWRDLYLGPKLYLGHIQKDSKVASGQEVSTVTLGS